MTQFTCALMLWMNLLRRADKSCLSHLVTFSGVVEYAGTILFTGRSHVEEEVRKYFTESITTPVDSAEHGTGDEANSAFSWLDGRCSVRLKYIMEEAYGL